MPVNSSTFGFVMQEEAADLSLNWADHLRKPSSWPSTAQMLPRIPPRRSWVSAAPCAPPLRHLCNLSVLGILPRWLAATPSLLLLSETPFILIFSGPPWPPGTYWPSCWPRSALFFTRLFSCCADPSAALQSHFFKCF